MRLADGELSFVFRCSVPHILPMLRPCFAHASCCGGHASPTWFPWRTRGVPWRRNDVFSSDWFLAQAEVAALRQSKEDVMKDTMISLCYKIESHKTLSFHTSSSKLSCLNQKTLWIYCMFFLSLCRLKDMECLRKTHEEATHWTHWAWWVWSNTLYSSIFGRGVFHCFPDSLRRWFKKAKNRTRRCLTPWHWNFLSGWVRNRLQAVELVEAEKQVALAKSKERWGGVTGLWLVKGSLLVQNVGWLRARLV